jgi:hypothetical protein
VTIPKDKGGTERVSRKLRGGGLGFRRSITHFRLTA